MIFILTFGEDLFFRMNTKTFNSPKKVDRKDREQARSEQLARQTRVLNILIDVMDLLSEYLAGSSYSLSMKDVSTHLNESGKYDVMDLKTASQYNYILIDLAKSHKNKFVAKDKIEIRCLYVQDRLRVFFKPELHEDVMKAIMDHPTLFTTYEEMK